VQFKGTVKSYDPDEGVGCIVREPEGQEVRVSSTGLALGVDCLYEGDSVEFDVGTGTDWEARNVMRC